MFYWGPSEPLQERPASFFTPTESVGSWAPQVRIWGLGGRGRGRGSRGTLSQPARRESARPSPGSGESLEHKAIFIYDTVSGLASV